MQKEITFDRLIRWMGTGLLIVAVLYLVNYLSSVLLPFFVAWLFAYLLYPIVKFVETRGKIRIRALAIILTMLLVFIVIGLIVYLIIPPMVEQFQKLYEILTHWMHETTHTSNISDWLSKWVAEHQAEIEKFFKSPDFTETLKTAAPKLFSIVGQTANVVISIIASLITLLYMFFILLDYEYLNAAWVKIFPSKNRPFWNDMKTDVARELNNYIRGQGLVSLIMGAMFCVGFTIIDFPMAIGLGLMIGILNLVPYLHTFALIPTAFLAMLKAADTGQNFWLTFGLAVIVFIVVQLISDMFVTPKVMGKAMGLNPAILLLSLSIWGAILGFIGLIIALPLTTLIIAYWKRYVTRDEDEMVLEEPEQDQTLPTSEIPEK